MRRLRLVGELRPRRRCRWAPAGASSNDRVRPVEGCTTMEWRYRAAAGGASCVSRAATWSTPAQIPAVHAVVKSVAPVSKCLGNRSPGAVTDRCST